MGSNGIKPYELYYEKSRDDSYTGRQWGGKEEQGEREREKEEWKGKNAKVRLPEQGR